MPIAEDNITSLPTLLDRIGRRIDTAWHRIQQGEAEWVEGSLELAQALADGKKQCGDNDIAFGRWLIDGKHDHVGKNDRAALIGLASDLALARTVLTETTRRSYQLIWPEVESRFPNARKPDALKRGRRKGDRKAKLRQTDPHKETIIAQADAGMTSPEIAASVGVEGRAVRHELGREQIRRETLDELLGAAAVERFSDKGKLTIEDAIRIHKARLNKQFEQRVNEEVRRRIDAADDAAREQNKEMRKKITGLDRLVHQLGQGCVFTKTQFRQMLMLCHPDNSAGPQLRAELLQLLVDNETKLVKPEKK